MEGDRAVIYEKYIERVPGVLGGEPVIKGTRIPVLAAVEYMELYGSLSRVAEIFPDVPLEYIQAALDYYNDHKPEIERYRQGDEQSDREVDETPDLFRLSA